jgi:hypothetical protein
VRLITVAEFLTPAEIVRAARLFRTTPPEAFAATVEREIITPNLARIHAALGQANDARYLAYVVEYAIRKGR